MDIKVIGDLMAMFKASGLTAVEIDDGALKIRMENNAAPVITGGGEYTPVQPAPVIPAAEPTAAAPAPAEPGITVDAPMVGVYHSLEALGKKPLNPGDTVDSDTVICAIEAMKMMCEIKAEKSGVFVENLLSDGAQVEFGTPLIKLK